MDFTAADYALVVTWCRGKIAAYSRSWSIGASDVDEMISAGVRAAAAVWPFWREDVGTRRAHCNMPIAVAMEAYLAEYATPLRMRTKTFKRLTRSDRWALRGVPETEAEGIAADDGGVSREDLEGRVRALAAADVGIRLLRRAEEIEGRPTRPQLDTIAADEGLTPWQGKQARTAARKRLAADPILLALLSGEEPDSGHPPAVAVRANAEKTCVERRERRHSFAPLGEVLARRKTGGRIAVQPAATAVLDPPVVPETHDAVDAADGLGGGPGSQPEPPVSDVDRGPAVPISDHLPAVEAPEPAPVTVEVVHEVEPPRPHLPWTLPRFVYVYDASMASPIPPASAQKAHGASVALRGRISCGRSPGDKTHFTAGRDSLGGAVRRQAWAPAYPPSSPLVASASTLDHRGASPSGLPVPWRIPVQHTPRYGPARAAPS